MNKIKVQSLEFYITNSCNLNCEGCNSISNFNVPANPQIWDHVKDTYSKWSEILDIDKIAIIGGEPLSNPDYKSWVVGLRQLWPNSSIAISTNALLFDKKSNSDLYELCNEYNIWLIVSLHNKTTADTVISNLCKWLIEPIQISELTEDQYVDLIPREDIYGDVMRKNYNLIKAPDWPECNNIDDWNNLSATIRNECTSVHNFTFTEEVVQLPTAKIIKDVNGVTLLIKEEWEFFTGIINHVENTFMFNNSDADVAHSVCTQRSCHQMYQGKLHKCAPSHVFKDIVDNFNTNLSADDALLIRSYQPASLDMSFEEIKEFINNLSNPIAQCKFCPDYLNKNIISAKPGKKHLFTIKK
jgi:organic radical activating enzyme